MIIAVSPPLTWVYTACLLFALVVLLKVLTQPRANGQVSYWQSLRKHFNFINKLFKFLRKVCTVKRITILCFLLALLWIGYELHRINK